jgi:hypothetical protein
MADTDTWAMRKVKGGELYVRRVPGGRWEVNFYEQVVNPTTALMEGFLFSKRLDGPYFKGCTFESPDEAARTMRRLLGG